MPDFNMEPFTDIRPELQISWSPSSIITIANYIKQCKEVIKNFNDSQKQYYGAQSKTNWVEFAGDGNPSSGPVVPYNAGPVNGSGA